MSEMAFLWLSRVGKWFKPPGLNQLKLDEFMPLAGINSILPGLNRFKLVKTTGWHKSIYATGWHKSKLSWLFSNPVTEKPVSSLGRFKPEHKKCMFQAWKSPPQATKSLLSRLKGPVRYAGAGVVGGNLPPQLASCAPPPNFKEFPRPWDPFEVYEVISSLRVLSLRGLFLTREGPSQAR